ncbi:MAG: archease [Candidatus Nanoarchaeia archaeon]|nr:archease [Candidatus Nanoarchaeia archaeon]
MEKKRIFKLRKYRFLEHTADIKFMAWGKTIEKLFENCAFAISNFLSKGQDIQNKIKKKFKITGKDYEEVLYNFIDGMIYLLDAENFITIKTRVKITRKKEKIELEVALYGDKAGNYENLDHIKSATYSEMYVKKIPEGWEAQAVVDV